MFQTARIRDHVGLSERQRMHRTANHGPADSDTNKSPQRLRVPKRVSATLALDHAIVKTESIDNVHCHEALVETKDTERQKCLSPCRRQGRRWGLESHCMPR